LSWLRRKKEVKVELAPVTTTTDLEKLLADDKETYEALRHAMFLDPRKPEITARDAAEKAKKAEKDGRKPAIVTQMY
jgi:protein-disulfide isomerase